MNEFNARELRRIILKMAFSGQTVHIGCAFSIVEILAVLYARHLNLDRADPAWPLRDYLVLSKGHGVMAQYACLAQLGWISAEEIDRYFGDGTRLKGLADVHVPGIEASTGSLGHGLSVGVGLALAAKLNGSTQRCFVIVGDGEINEGSIWEAMLFATQFQLDNLIVLVDNNGFQAMGSTLEVMQLGDIERKFAAFGFDAVTVAGHDESSLDAAVADAKQRQDGRPKAIIANTVKGRGVSFMENNNVWHYSRLTPETFASAMAEIEVAL